ncbi:protein of unknown function [Candidatus Filomicrobium marinum]|uniref:Uncharacterized protein n=1 Tax=Candidatus Filomicrobium marinum TaxID=1608628 RepID=A0A0D6JK10_9HYPH|nr:MULTISPECIES: hypothetical protein [Filomicrobium]CFX57530.1 protein of unknown function [Candidatus Filomicrobium marinum]CPR22286.1 protein of unknown function [Candidatus Filomicrobium marinum]
MRISTSNTFAPVDISAPSFTLTTRHDDCDFDVVDAAGYVIATPGLKNFQSIAVGSQIAF